MEQEIIILVYYLNINQLKPDEIEEYVYRIHEQFEKVVWPENYYVKTFIIPVSDQRTKLDCIYPVNMSDKDINKAFQVLSDASEQLIKFVKNGISTDNITDESK